VTPASEWTIAGKSLAKVDARAFVTGRHQYTSDLRPAGVMYGKVLRPPSLGATMTSCDLTGAQKLPSVVLVHDGDFVGAAAPSESEADEAIAAIHAQWKEAPQPSSSELFSYLKQNVETSDREDRTQSGSIADGLAHAAHRLDRTYTIAYIAHAPLEPRAAVAEWKDGKLTVWTGSQRPFGVRGELTAAFGLAEDRVRVIVPDTGSGYGGKHSGEAAVEAARLARTAGRPVKLVWTREEEFTWAYFRPAGVIDIESGVNRDG